MSETILTKSHKGEGRVVETEKPEILCMTNIADFVTVMGEDAVVKTVMAQLTVSFRSHVRTKLESQTDGDHNYTIEEIANMDFSDWKPESRVRKTAQEKAMELLGKFTGDEVKALLAKLDQ